MEIHAKRGRLVKHHALAVGMPVSGYAADVEKALDLRLAGGGEHVPRTVDGDGHETLPRPPVADLGGDVVDPLDALHCLDEALRIGYVPKSLLDAPLIEQAGIAGWTNKGSHRLAHSQKLLHDVAAQKTAGACDKIHYRSKIKGLSNYAVRNKPPFDLGG